MKIMKHMKKKEGLARKQAPCLERTENQGETFMVELFIFPRQRARRQEELNHEDYEAHEEERRLDSESRLLAWSEL